MVAFVDLGPVPTVNLLMAVPVALGNGGWSWGEFPRFPGVLAREYAYSAAECAALVKSYGAAVARMLKPSEAERFCLVLRGTTTGAVVHRAEWAWNFYARAFVPDGESWCGWKAAARAYWEMTGELVGSQRFEPRSGLLAMPERKLARVIPFAPAAEPVAC
ncbi:hypothetical protein [Streptomyces sp. NPDC055006]